MAITVVGVGAQVNRNGTGTLTVPWPSAYSPIAGDVAVVFEYNTILGATRPAVVSGYTVVDEVFTGSSVNRQTRVLYRVLNGSESEPQITTVLDYAFGAALAIFRGVNLGTPLDATPTKAGPVASSTTYTPPTITTVTDSAMVVSVVQSFDDNALALSSAQSFTLLAGGAAYDYTGTVDASLGVASRTLTTAGTPTMPTWQQTVNGPDGWNAITFAFRPAPAAIGSAVATGTADRTINRNATATGAAVATGTAITPYLRTATGSASLVGVAKAPTSRLALGEAISSGQAVATWQPSNAIIPQTIDDSFVTGPEAFGSVPAIEPATIDSGIVTGPNFPANFAPNPPLAPVVDPVILPVAPTFVPYSYATLENGQIITTAANWSWSDPLSDTGVATVEIALSDPLISSITPGARIRFWLYGIPAFTMLVETAQQRAIQSEEEPDAILIAQGRGWLAELDYARIEPYLGTGRPVTAQSRMWSFASPNFPNLSGWGQPVSQGQVAIANPLRFVMKEQRVLLGEADKSPDGTVIVGENGEPVASDETDVRASRTVKINTPFPAPLEWLVPEAHWIWGNEEELPGYCYFRHEFTVSGNKRVSIAATGDDLWTVFFDGIPILGESQNVYGWQTYKEVTFDITAGTYTIGAIVWNRVRPGPKGPNNPGGFVLAAYELAPDDTVRELFTTTDADFPPGGLVGRDAEPNPIRRLWQSLAYPSQEPGWFIGQMLADMVAEAKARSAIPDIVLGFTDSADSDGQMWEGANGSGSFLPVFSAPIGSSILDALKRLDDQGWIEYHIEPGAPVVLAYNYGQAGNVTSATFTQGVNITALTIGIAPTRYDRLLVKWSGGTFSVGSGPLEGYITLNVTDEGEALRQAQTILADLNNPEPPLLMSIEPQVGPKPYLDFGVGDWVTVTGIGLARVRAINVQADEDGNPIVTLELNRKWPSAERERQSLLRTLGSGAVGRTRSDVLTTTNPVGQ
jgi:hypothetical protein